MFDSDKFLIKGCKKGKPSAQESLYAKYSKAMYAVALRYVKVIQEAEDILQESFIKVFQNIGKFRGDSSLPYWIKRIVVNTALNHQRSKLFLYPMVDVENLDDRVVNEDVFSEFSYQELVKMIMTLPDGCRIIFNMYAIEGYKHHEIAERLKISEGTSKSQYSRAKKLLIKMLESKGHVKYG
jgi:RNA polymerase sigma factor (sigma-70 family)|tara:strand:- start:1228 stop:1773 length:546 start_codon:yes stop_codon:yes gene_type:complete